MLTVFGTAALDTIRTPTRTVREVLGGAATFAGVSASFFAKTGLLAAVGEDFPDGYRKMLADHLDLAGFTVMRGKTFRYDGRYDATLNSRETIKTELNVAAEYSPSIPDVYRGSKFLYLATNDPEKNMALLDEFDGIKFSISDTIDFWIKTKREAVRRMVGSVDAMMINAEEARLLTKEENLVRCARKMMDWGATYVVIKKGEHGSVMFHREMIFPMAAFPLDNVVDPTGAGDSFAGGVIGYLASKNSTALSAIRRAMIFGNVMGSFVVEEYGLDRLLRLKKSEIAKRVRAYEKMIAA